MEGWDGLLPLLLPLPLILTPLILKCLLQVVKSEHHQLTHILIHVIHDRPKLRVRVASCTAMAATCIAQQVACRWGLWCGVLG